MEIERCYLGYTGIHLPRVGLQASQPFDVIGKESQSARAGLVRAAIDRGIDFFSTSPDYGEAERILAAGLIGYRHRSTILSIVRTLNVAEAYRQIDVSLHLFDGKVDLFLASAEASDGLLNSLARMRAVGEAGAIGIECRSLDELRSIAPKANAEGIDVIGISATLLLNAETREILCRKLPDHCGVIASVPDGLDRLSGSSIDELKLNVSGHGLKSFGDVLLKLATSEPRIASVTAPARRRRDLDRIEDIALSPALSRMEMDALRTG